MGRKTNFFYKVVANTMQYKYQEASCNLPTLGTDCLCGMMQTTDFGPLRHCKKYTLIIILRDATMLSCCFPKSTGVFLPDLHCEQQNCMQGAKKNPAGLASPHSAAAFWWCNHNSASGEFNMDLCAERVQGLGKLSCALQTTQIKISQHELFCCMTLSPHGTSVKWKRSCMITDITTQTMYTIIAW